MDTDTRDMENKHFVRSKLCLITTVVLLFVLFFSWGYSIQSDTNAPKEPIVIVRSGVVPPYHEKTHPKGFKMFKDLSYKNVELFVGGDKEKKKKVVYEIVD